jgi:hypothetical protein
MFSKFVFAYPLSNKDAATICEALYHMFTTSREIASAENLAAFQKEFQAEKNQCC